MIRTTLAVLAAMLTLAGCDDTTSSDDAPASDTAPTAEASFDECVTDAGFEPATAPADTAHLTDAADSVEYESEAVAVVDGDRSATVLSFGDDALVVVQPEDADAFSVSGVVADPSSIDEVLVGSDAQAAVDCLG